VTIPGFEDTLKSATPPVPPAIGGGRATELAFPGVGKPTSDMQAVRDGRRSTLLGYLVDLTNARSFAAGTQLLLDIQGNVFLSDPLFDLTGNSLAGVARVHFQDENFNPVGTYVTVLPSAIYKVPFTRVAVENYAQPGKFLYIVYGVDIDLVPGSSQQVQATVNNLAQQLIGGVQELVVMERGYTYGANYKSSTALAANTPDAVFTPASNVNGAILWAAAAWTWNGTNVMNLALLAKASAPATAIDGDLLTSGKANSPQAGSYTGLLDLARPVFIAAGKGLYFLSSVAEANAFRSASYTLL